MNILYISVSSYACSDLEYDELRITVADLGILKEGFQLRAILKDY